MSEESHKPAAASIVDDDFKILHRERVDDGATELGSLIVSETPPGHEVIFKVVNVGDTFEVTEEERITPELRVDLDRHREIVRIDRDKRTREDTEELVNLVKSIPQAIEGWRSSEDEDPVLQRLEEIRDELASLRKIDAAGEPSPRCGICKDCRAKGLDEGALAVRSLKRIEAELKAGDIDPVALGEVETLACSIIALSCG